MSRLERLREIESRYQAITSGCQYGDTCQCQQQLANIQREIATLEKETKR